ncbi:MAG: nucleotidyl transferase AbiEii/AbiGii toxin family protein [Candidatus Omnitrophota bacterium]
MKVDLLRLVSKKDGLNAKMNMMREYLQAYILRIMYDNGVFRSTAFLGGTALRFLYDLPRFSEDMDFSIVEKGGKHDFPAIVKKIKDEFASMDYNIFVSSNDKNTVRYAFFKFEGLMYEAGISSLKTQKFSVKIEIDANPPEGAVSKSIVVNKYFPIGFLSYDIPSLFSCKLHAILCRKYTKGRDLFDLGWYLSKWKGLSPNLTLLKNALTQTGWKDGFPDENNWRDYVYEAVKKVQWEKVRSDIRNFLENPSDLEVFSQKNVLNLIKA